MSRKELARVLATDERRQAARKWVADMAEANEAHFPLLAEELRRLASASPARRPEHDAIWLEACFGLALIEGHNES